jgi:hypothetical protein
VIYVKVTINPKLTRLIDKLPDDLKSKALPKAFLAAARVIRKEMQRKLPDGTKTRKKQSKKAKARYVGRTRDNIRTKLIQDDTGVLRIVGVDVKKAGQINFDHGKKARGRGREHKLWFVENEHEFWHKDGRAVDSVAYRKQTRDYAEEIIRSKQSQVIKVIERSIIRQVEKSAK